MPVWECDSKLLGSILFKVTDSTSLPILFTIYVSVVAASSQLLFAFIRDSGLGVSVIVI